MLTEYTPDAWVILKINNKENGETLYKVFAQWYGGFAGSDSWKINSGITSVQLDGNHYCFSGYSGSVYRCHKNTYRTTGYGHSVIQQFIREAEGTEYEFHIMEDCDWLSIKYE
jgi:hypothetical protein